MAARYLVLLPVLVLPGCITKALWHKEEVLPKLLTVTVPCEVLEVTASADADDQSIHVRFSPQAASEVPSHLRGFDSDRPGVFELQPPISGGVWKQLPGAELFATSSWDLRISSATYFGAGPANARLNFHGVVGPGDLGELVPLEQLPPELRQLGGELWPGTHWESHCLEAFQAHGWMELLGPTLPDIGHRPLPLAWVDGDLNLIQTTELPDDPDEARARLRGLRLLGRVSDGTGNQRYMLIDVPVLLQGADLYLRRDGAEVQWSHSEVWHARQLADASRTEARIPFTIPLRGQSFDYRWSREIEESELEFDVLRVLATPLTAALDFLIMTNGPLSQLARWLSGEDEKATSTPPPIRR